MWQIIHPVFFLNPYNAGIVFRCLLQSVVVVADNLSNESEICVHSHIQGSATRRREWRHEVKCVPTQVSD